MNHKIICYTLFDITQTNVPNRPCPSNIEDVSQWLYKRNTQANFDTILQAISLRSQPEYISIPQKFKINFEDFDKFGFLYESEEVSCWYFMFEVQHSSVFEDGIKDFGLLYDDCNEIPMILCGTEWDKLSNNLDTTPECKNIYFEKL